MKFAKNFISFSLFVKKFFFFYYNKEILFFKRASEKILLTLFHYPKFFAIICIVTFCQQTGAHERT